MTAVWEKSTHKGGELLLLLALADRANEEGYCWPGLDNLTKRCRVSKNTLIKYTLCLEQSGELIVCRRPGIVNLYIVLTGLPDAETLAQKYFGWSAQDLAEYKQDINARSGVKPTSEHGFTTSTSEHGFTTPVNTGSLPPVNTGSPDPSIETSKNHQLSPGGDAPGLKEPKRKRDLMFDAVAEVWNTEAGGYIGLVKAQLLGKTKKNRDPSCDIKPPMTSDEVLSFGKWYRRTYPGLDMVQQPAKIQREVYKFRKERQEIAKIVTAAQPTNVRNVYAEAGVIWQRPPNGARP